VALRRTAAPTQSCPLHTHPAGGPLPHAHSLGGEVLARGDFFSCVLQHFSERGVQKHHQKLLDKKFIAIYFYLNS
jgi:hypothetical protein